MKKFWADILIGFRTSPARSTLAFISLTIGIFSMTVLLASLEALRHQSHDLQHAFGAHSFAILPTGEKSSIPLTRRHVAYLRENLPHAIVSGMSRLPSPSANMPPLIAIDEQWIPARKWAIPQGRTFDAVDITRGARHALVSASLMEAKNWHIGDMISLADSSFYIIGSTTPEEAPIEKETQGAAILVGENSVFIPYTTSLPRRELHECMKQVDMIFVHDPSGAPHATRAKAERLLEQPDWEAPPLEWITPDRLLARIRRWQQTISWIAGTAGGLGLLLGGVTLASLLLSGVRERIPEIGLRRALGAQQRDIALLFIFEALVLTLGAAGVGILGAELTVRTLGGHYPLPYLFNTSVRCLPLGLALVLAVICSFLPARQAARLQPGEALRND